jgi:hypothetical protein
LAALHGGLPDRLPATTHHLMPSFLRRRMGGISDEEFFDRFGLDPVEWLYIHRADPSRNERVHPDHSPAHLEPDLISSETWKMTSEPIPDPQYPTVRYSFHTPRKTLSMVLQSDEHTTWVTERLVKEKTDIDLIAEYATHPVADVQEVNRLVEQSGGRGVVRGTINCFDIYGQPGCWQDAAVLFGIEELIISTYDDPDWVKAFLQVLLERKKVFTLSLEGARYDLLEFGGGDASSTVISPQIFDRFVAPYDSQIISLAHEVGQRVVYHTCGGMMPLLERIRDMGPDAMETFTPAAMGGDADLKEAKERIGDRVCMIGGFDQFHFFRGCTPEETRRAVRDCFRDAGEGGRYILAPSDHFFEADVELLEAFADEARKCTY